MAGQLHTQNDFQRPLLRWAGSKRKLLPILLSSIPSFSRYVEPFAGSACLFFALYPGRAILSDFNHELMETYYFIREHPLRVAETLAQMPSTPHFYYSLRSMKPTDLDPINKAARFIYLNRHCFNGVYRTNRQGAFNVPRGIRTGSMPSPKEFLACAAMLRGAVLLAGDFEGALSDVKKGDFVYLDPPYAKPGSQNLGEYGYGAFSEADLPRLFVALEAIDRKGATFLLSYRYSRRLVSSIERWNYRTVMVRRHVAGFVKHRSNVKELLVSNNRLRLFSTSR
jgi:DNA adenine methylase